jgi:pimeloyl-ACP methyl ester carboxylesterase
MASATRDGEAMNTLLMIPAFGCDQSLYVSQLAALKGQVHCKCIVAGQDRYDKMVAEVLQQAPEEFAILGTSMGGRLAFEVALAAPDRVQALCVIGAAAGPVADAVAGRRRSQRIRGGERTAVIAEMGRMIAHLPGPRGPETEAAFQRMGNAIDLEVLARQSDALANRVDLWGRVAEISCPVLCLWGKYDQFSPATDGLRLAEAVQDGSFVALPGCGHFPTLEYPDQATAAIKDWLAGAGLI